MWILLITAVSTLLAMHVKTKELVCAKTEGVKSTIVAYQTVSGKKGARGLKGTKGESGGMTEQELDKLEGKQC